LLFALLKKDARYSGYAHFVTNPSILNSTLTAMTAKVYAKSARDYKLLTTRLMPFLIKITLKR